MTLLDKMKEKSPVCVLCAGRNPTETTDHIPPKSIFSLKMRPRGLEFPACRACNQGSKLDDLIIGWFSRMYPDPADDAEAGELRKLTKSVSRKVPGLLSEMKTTFNQKKRFRRQVPDRWKEKHPLNVSGPILNEAILCFGGKMGLALHFEKTGNIVPQTGRAVVRWFSNYQALTGGIPKDSLSQLGSAETLKMGKWNVADQFQFYSAWDESGEMSVHYSTFRKSFAVLVAVFSREDELVDEMLANSTGNVSPGWLIGRIPKYKKLRMW